MHHKKAEIYLCHKLVEQVLMRAITLHKESAIVYRTEVIALEEQKSYLRENPRLYMHEVELLLYDL